MNEQVIKAGEHVLYTLEKAGYTAYFVGGYVRDTLLGRPVHDLDIATSARPDAVMALFARTIPTGLAHGTVTVLENGVPLEVTTFRTESGYADHRRPDEVRFVTDIVEDLARRDFTVNAMALDLRGNVVDPFGGQQDLQARLIRAVGRAEERFAEDALRMLRCLRFASQLGFTIDPSTYEAIGHQAADIGYVAVERISAEWNKALAGLYPDDTVTYAYATGLASHMPGINRLLEEKQVFSAEENAKLRAAQGLVLRWAYLFLICGRETEVEAILRTLRCEKKLVKACQQTVALTLKMQESTASDKLMEWLVETGFEAVSAAWALYEIQSGTERHTDLLHLYETMQVHSLQELAINGADLQREMRRQGGPWVRDLLVQLALHVNKGQVKNEQQTLLLRARMILDENT